MTQTQAAFDRFSSEASRVGANPALILGFIADRLQDEPPAQRAGLPDSERFYLEQSGGLKQTAEPGPSFGELIARQAAVDALRFATTSEVADLLGIDESRVRHRRGAGDLIAHKIGRELRYPLWQFAQSDSGASPLPNLKKLSALLPVNMHPAEVSGRMTTAQPELEVNGMPVTPREWLSAGGDIDALREVFEDEQSW